jgi:lipoprotein-releasing system ATP-binding protein
MSEVMLQLENISKSYPQPAGEVEVLKPGNLAIEKGEVVALVGASGSGKTTLLQIAGLLARPNQGDVKIDAQSMTQLNEAKLTKLRLDKLGFVYQFHHLLPEFTALENVALPHMIVGNSRKDAEGKAVELLDELGLSNRLDHRPSQLSGGEMQRVAIARALVNDPVLLLADEPTGNLDDTSSETVFNALMEAVAKRKMTALIVTHDRKLAERMDRTVSLENGQLFS